MENKLGTCRMLKVDVDENKYPPTVWGTFNFRFTDGVKKILSFPIYVN
jgi:hypothetical protein